MKLHIDSFMTCGKSHHVCEDYAISDEYPVPNLIISDGCSSSFNTDVGARILVHAAKKELAAVPLKLDHSFGEYVLRSASGIQRMLGIDQSCLDATLMICCVEGSWFRIKVWGDGVVVVKTATMTRVTEIKYDNNMPYYLSYLRDVDSRQLYENANGLLSRRLIDWSHGPLTRQEFTIRDPYFYTVDLYYERDTVEYIFLSTDGISSFVDEAKAEMIPLSDVVRECTAFKNTTGDFLKRRMRKMIETYEKDRIRHLDDIGVGCIYVEK